jgi:tetratricopeptide (TPR) repeat protein
MPALVEYLDEQASQIVERLDSGASTVMVEGPGGTGRTQLLFQTAANLRQTGRHPIVIAPPERQMDTASLALLDCGVGLANAGLLDRELSATWSLRASWRERTDQLREWLAKEAPPMGDVVLLCDDVRQWSVPEAVDSARRVESVADLFLRESPCAKVVIGRLGDLRHDAHVAIDYTAMTAGATEDRSRWAALSGVAQEVRAMQVPTGARSPSAVQLGLLVAYAALFSVDDLKSWWSPRVSTERLAERLARGVANDRRLRPLWNLWLTASVLRRPAPSEWLEQAKALVTDEVQAAVAERCLIFGESDVRLAREARTAAWRQDGEFAQRVQQRAAQAMLGRYVDVFEAAVDNHQPESLQHAAEALYMAGRVGDTNVVDRVAPNFADQLDAIGAASLERDDRESARKAFEMAIEWDPDDAFAHHSLGFALDADGLEPRRVEHEYRYALRLDSSQAVWHARLVSFLIVRARDDDARASWEEALPVLAGDDGDGSADLYQKLHLPVCANLLRRAEVGFAHEVLADIPEWARPHLLAYPDQRRRLELLEQAVSSGVFVPAQRASPEWWLAGPQLLEERGRSGELLSTWMAARVDELDDDGIYLSVAVIEAMSLVETGTMSLSWDEVRALATDTRRLAALEAGQFLELGYYGSDEEASPVIRVLAPDPWPDGLYTQLDPGRFLPAQ